MMKDAIANYKLILAGIVIFVTGCSDMMVPQTEQGTVGVEFVFREENMCQKGKSPELTINNIPPDTKLFRITLKDVDNPHFNHGGGEVPFIHSNIIGEGALNAYFGPCPPKDYYGRFTYCFKVEAVDSNNRVIAWGRSCRECGWLDFK